MKQSKYKFVPFLIVFIPLLAIVGVFLLILFYIYSFKWALILGGILVLLPIISIKPVHELQLRYNAENNYDEFGRSKTKGDYKRLSKAERDEIDLQKTAAMEMLISSTVIDKITHEGSIDPQKDMDSLIGLYPVKNKMNELVARMRFENEKMAEENKGKKKKDYIKPNLSGNHLIFFGPPGTGKTTVARIWAGFLYQNGYIPKNNCVEIDGNFLMAGESTALKTEYIIQRAYDGVLFIDEAYTLATSNAGRAAIATIIKQMEDHRDRFVLILAGYTNEMKELLEANPGFTSRIKEYMSFPDYSIEELGDIFVKMANENNFVVDQGAIDNFKLRIQKEQKLNSFGNARTVRNVLDESISKHAQNFYNGELRELDALGNEKDNRYRLMQKDVSTQINYI